MNKIFKVIWSKARNCYVVVSELAKSHDDGHVRRSRSGCCRKVAILAALALTTSLAAGPVWAADSKENINNVVTIKDNQKDISAMTGINNLNGTGNVVYGTGNTADKSGAVIVGKNSKGDKDSVVIGNNAQSNAENQIIIGQGTANGGAIGSIIIGNINNTVDTSQSVLIGNNTKANGSGQGVIVMGNGAMADSNAAGYTDNGKYIPAGIVLGEYSYSNTRAGKEGYLSNNNKGKPSTAFTDEYWNAVWKATANPMAIGNADTDANGKGEGHNGHGVLTRQITGVAAGTDLTDAVNVAQLKAAVAQFSGGGSGTGGSGVHDYSVNSVDSANDSNYNNTGATGNNALAAGVSASATRENAVAIGTGARAEGKGATVIGQYAKATGDYATAFGGKHYIDRTNREVTLINEATGIASTAFGEGAQAKGEASLAFGHNTVAGVDGGNGQQSVAFGENTQALGGRSLAFGENTRAEFNDSVAFGNGSQALSTGAMAHGNRTSAVGQYTTTWGNNTVAAGENSTAFGKDAMAGAIDENGAVIVNYNNQSTKIDKNGYKAYVDANDNTQSGTYTVNGGETHNYVILAGTDKKKYICDYHGDIREVTSIDDNGVITAGNVVTNAPVTKIVGGTNGFNVDGHQNATAFGNATRATAAESTAWGQGSIASGEASTAFGIKSKAEGKNSLAGLGGQAVNENSIALGKDTKANNAQQAVSVAIGENAEASGARSLAIGFGVKGKVTEGGVEKDDTTLTQTTASGESAVSIGTDTQAAGQHSIAFGSHTEATKDSSLAIGYDTHATDASAVAIGSGTKVNRGYGVAIGLSALAGIDESDPSSSGATTLDGSQTVAFGYYARATATNAAALGAATSANVNGGVALGYGSATTRAAGNKVNGVEQTAYLKPASVDSTNSTWTSTAGAVSVGNVGAKQSITRQITDVAAGSKDTDAVNVAQLKQAGFTVTANTDATAGSSIKTGETLDFKAEDNAIVSTTKDSKTITVKVSKTPTFDSVKTGDTVINNDGMTITKKEGDKTTTVSLTDKGLDNGGNKITHVAAGAISDTSTDAVNGSQLKKVETLAGKHTAVTVDGKAPQDTTYVGDNLKLNVTDKDGQKTYDLKLNDTLNLGQAGKDGKDGVDGSIGLKGADGKSSIGLNGKDGISVIGADGRNGVSITGSNGQDGLDGKIAIGTPGKDGQPGKDAISLSGKDGIGHIGLTGPKGTDGQDSAMIDISTVIGQATLDKDKNSPKGQFTGAERITYTDSQGSAHEVATMDDGRKYGGDNYVAATGKDAEQNVITKKLNERLDIHGGADKDNLSENNIGVNAAEGVLKVQLAKKIDLTKDGSVTMGNTVINNDGMTITKKEGDKTTTVSLTDKGLDNGGNRITNVVAGTNDTDAVNVSQLNDVKTLAGQHTTVEAGSKNITVTEGTNSTGGKNYTVDLAKDVAFGNSAKGDKTVAISGTNGTVTAGTGDNKVTVDGSKGQIVAGGDNGVKIGNIAEGDSSLTIYDKDGKATDKKADGGKFVTNLDNKTWKNDGSYVSGRAATEDQLHQVESNVNKQIADVNTKIDKVDKHHTEVTVNGGTVAPTTENTYSEGNLQIAQKTGDDGQKVYDLKLSDNLNIGGAGKDGAPGKDGHIGINGADGKSGVGIDGKDGISIKGKDGKDGVTIKGIDGKNGTEGHIGLTGSAGKDGQNASADIHVKNGQVGVDGTDGHGGKDGMDRVVYEDHNHVTHEVATMDDGMKYSGDSGKAAVKLNKNVQIYGGATEYADGNNIGVVASQDGDNAKLQVKLAKDLKGISSIEAKTITTGDTTMDNSGLTVKGNDNHKDITIHQGNVNMGGNKVSGVADGKVSKDSTDAVNGSQLWQRDQAINSLGGAVNKLDSRVNRVGAGAAALAALHPLDFDPDDKWDFAAGYGNYRGANAAAVGAYYRPNEDTMFSVGGSFGGGENMVNAGVSFKVGQGNHVSTSRVAMAKEIKDLRQNVANLNAIVNRQSALIDKLTGTNAGMIKDKGNDLFPDVPANHWAYEYVTKLKQAGILTGYPDGNFDGDRMMTRYEFAAIVYRAIMAGAASNPALNQDGTLDKLANEFSSEMKYIRIDTIAKDKNGKPTIERVRVISDAK